MDQRESESEGAPCPFPIRRAAEGLLKYTMKDEKDDQERGSAPAASAQTGQNMFASGVFVTSIVILVVAIVLLAQGGGSKKSSESCAAAPAAPIAGWHYALMSFPNRVDAATAAGCGRRPPSAPSPRSMPPSPRSTPSARRRQARRHAHGAPRGGHRREVRRLRGRRGRGVLRRRRRVGRHELPARRPEGPGHRRRGQPAHGPHARRRARRHGRLSS